MEDEYGELPTRGDEQTLVAAIQVLVVAMLAESEAAASGALARTVRSAISLLEDWPGTTRQKDVAIAQVNRLAAQGRRLGVAGLGPP